MISRSSSTHTTTTKVFLEVTNGPYYQPSMDTYIIECRTDLEDVPGAVLCTVRFNLLQSHLRHELIFVNVEKLGRLNWMRARNIMKAISGDVVGLPFANERVIFEQILSFGFVMGSLKAEKTAGLVAL